MLLAAACLAVLLCCLAMYDQMTPKRLFEECASPHFGCQCYAFSCALLLLGLAAWLTFAQAWLGETKRNDTRPFTILESQFAPLAPPPRAPCHTRATRSACLCTCMRTS